MGCLQEEPTMRSLKSTFKGLWNYHGHRDQLGQAPFDWLQDKVRDDNVGDLWRVHDKLYDLRDFIQQHPGGSDFIRLSQGTDITEGFEVSHIVNFDRVEKVLAKYYVRDAETPRNSPYTFETEGFYKTLKTRAAPILEKVGTGPTLRIKLYQDGIVLLFFVAAMAGALSESLILLAFAGLMLNFVMGCAHNFLHIRHTWRQYYFDLGLLSSLEWKIGHVLSHHNYPNTLLDFEITGFEPLFKFLPNKRKGWLQRHGAFFYQHLVFPIGLFPIFFLRVWNALMRKRRMRIESYLPLAELVALAFVAPSVGWALRSWFVIHSACSFAFMLTGFTTGHHHPSSCHDGDETRTSPDFGLCQLDATKDRAESTSESLFFNLVSFGDHPAHHLFPSVCHSKLHHLRPVILDTMRDFGMDYEHLDFLSIYLGLRDQYARMDPNPAPDVKARAR